MPAITPKPVKVFTRDNPCSKVDLHNCFYREGMYVARAVVEARGEIGVNAIKYLRRTGLANLCELNNVEYWQLTEEGQDWLTKGLARWLEIHPEQQSLLNAAPVGKKVIRRRARP